MDKDNVKKRYSWMPLKDRVRMSLQTMETKNSTRGNSRGLKPNNVQD